MNLVKVGYGIGRRKTAIAQVILKLGNGKLTINEKDGSLYLQNNPAYLQKLSNPFALLGLKDNFDIYVKTSGGGLTGQTDAIVLGIARALTTLDSQNRTILKTAGLLKHVKLSVKNSV
jgi:small subunit ribosomal protein S9